MNVVVHPSGARDGFRLPEDHLIAITDFTIRLEANLRGAEYAIARIEDFKKGERHVFLGSRVLGWFRGATGSGPWDYPFPTAHDAA